VRGVIQRYLFCKNKEGGIGGQNRSFSSSFRVGVLTRLKKRGGGERAKLKN